MSQPPVLPPNERRILRLDEVEAKSGFKRAHIYNLMKKRQFPQALRLGVRAVGWDSVEIEQQHAQARVRGEPAQVGGRRGLADAALR